MFDKISFDTKRGCGSSADLETTFGCVLVNAAFVQVVETGMVADAAYSTELRSSKFVLRNKITISGIVTFQSNFRLS